MENIKIQVWTTGQIAKALSLAPSTVKNWVARGLLAAEKVPGSQHQRISRDVLTAFLAAYPMHLGMLESYERLQALRPGTTAGTTGKPAGTTANAGKSTGKSVGKSKHQKLQRAS